MVKKNMESNITPAALKAYGKVPADFYAALEANMQARADEHEAEEAARLKTAFEAFDEMRERTLKSANESLDWAIDNIKSGTYSRRHILDIIDHAGGAIEECEHDPDNCDILFALTYAARAELSRECLTKQVIKLPHNERFWE